VVGIIYKAENIINNNCYIGKTIQSLNIRKARHKCNALTDKKNNYFYNAIRKYGFENFKWSILVETDSESKLNALEKLYIATYRKMGKLYNMSDGGEGQTGHIISNDTRKKLSKACKGKKNYFYDRHLYGELNGMYGKNHSEETRKKISENRNVIKLTEEWKNNISKNANNNSNFGMKGKKHSEETKKKISESLKGNIPWNKGKKVI
jgi:group I intron endonuclease